jgi:hypothetical protein
MLRGFRRVLGIAIVLTLAAGESRAQYYEGYGAYGWGGWGGGTVQGSIARGLGFYNMEAGAYNEETARANAINADTVERWNEYMFLAQQEANRREYLRRERLVRRDAKSGDALYQRVRDHPEERDIDNGDALNAILIQLTDPKIHSTALRFIKDPVSGKAIRQIPFVNASEAVTINLRQLTGEGGWPPALQGETFAPERQAYQDAIARAVKEDEQGQLSAQTIQEVNLAASRLRAKLEANKPADKAQYVEAVNHIKALLGMSRMLEKPQVDKILAELDSVKETTLGSLLGFMHTYNLRFAPANTPEQVAVYRSLYPIMDQARAKVLKDAEAGDGNSVPPVPRDNRRPASEFFQGMHLEHLEPRSNNDATKP